jgi:CubicO group peptidase (beta-lactamase class C family)
LLLVASVARAGDGDRLDDDGGFAEGSPDAASLARYRDAARYSRAHAGLALLVVEGDSVVFEEASNGYDLRRGHHIWSGTKTFACALAMSAVADGKLALDDHPARLLDELRRTRGADEIEVHNLLRFDSGLDRGRLASKPGERYAYVGDHLATFVAFMAELLGEDPLAYLHRRVLDPIGFRYTRWRRDGKGRPYLGIGALTTARSWARFGVLMRDDGRFRGREVLPPEMLAQCLHGSSAMPAYGFGIWLNEPVPPERRRHIPGVLVGPFAREGRVLWPHGPADLVAAVGYQDNRLYIIPSRGLVIVRFGRGHARFEDEDLLSRLLGP